MGGHMTKTSKLPALFIFCAFMAVLLFAIKAFAQDAAPADIPVGDFLQQVLAAVKGFGGLSWMLKVSSICLIIVSSMKVSFIQPLWAKLGTAQKWVAPFLALVGGFLGQGTAITWAGALAYLGAGAAAPYIHDLLDLIKIIPGLGPLWVSIIGMIEGLPLFGSKA